jgi:DNA-binding IclR family transcriptional regulator
MAQEKGEVDLAGLSKLTGISATTLFRLLYTLMRHEFIVQDRDTGKYRLGLKVVELGQTVLESIELRRIAFPFLQELTDKTGESTNLVVLEGAQAVYIEKVESPSSLRMFHRIGRHAPAHATGVGKVLLAALSPERVDELMGARKLTKLTDNTITDTDDLREELALVRSHGYALDNEECELGAKCIAAPVFNYANQVVAAISVAGPSTRLPSERLDDLVSKVKETALAISERLGYNAKRTQKGNNE